MLNMKELMCIETENQWNVFVFMTGTPSVIF